MRASARLVAELVDGRTRCTTLQSQPPLTFRQNPTGLMWVATAAGPVGGDDLRLDLRVEAGAALDVASAGASIVLPGAGGERSQSRLDVVLACRSSLVWHPEPAVLAADANHLASTSIVLGAEADLVWVDELVLGRHAEVPGRLTSQLMVTTVAGRPVLRTGLDIGGPGWDGPAVTDGRRGHAHIVLAGHPAERWRTSTRVCRPFVEVEWTSAELTGGVELVTLIGREPRHVRAAATAVAGWVSAR